MKTKLTLFFAATFAAMLGSGCASVPKPDVPSAVKWNGHWYAYFPDQISWIEAKKRCESLGGHLVIIESKDENEFVWELASATQPSGFLHMGCSRTGNDGKRVWLNGKLVSDTFHNWVAPNILGRSFDNRPSIEKYDTGGFALSQIADVPPKGWQIRGVEARNGFICEWE